VELIDGRSALRARSRQAPVGRTLDREQSRLAPIRRSRWGASFSTDQTAETLSCASGTVSRLPVSKKVVAALARYRAARDRRADERSSAKRALVSRSSSQLVAPRWSTLPSSRRAARVHRVLEEYGVSQRARAERVLLDSVSPDRRAADRAADGFSRDRLEPTEEVSRSDPRRRGMRDDSLGDGGSTFAPEGVTADSNA